MAKEIKLQKGKDIQVFHIFNDGTVKYIRNGLEKILDNFWEYYYSLVKNGYVEI